jgi:hypothetical protein
VLLEALVDVAADLVIANADEAVDVVLVIADEGFSQFEDVHALSRQSGVTVCGFSLIQTNVGVVLKASDDDADVPQSRVSKELSAEIGSQQDNGHCAARTIRLRLRPGA